MSLQKQRFIYKAVAEAIDAFGERHHLQARAHFAPILGFRGPNGHVQVSSMLNTTSYNPANPKRMSVDQLATLLHELDEPDRRFVLEKFAEEYGYNICKAPEAKREPVGAFELFKMVLEIDGAHGSFARTLKDAVEDGVVDDEEREAIREATFMLRKMVRKLEESLR